MMTIKIEINGELLFSDSVVNISEQMNQIYGKGKQYYRIESNRKIIEHKFEDGVIELAKKLLNSADKTSINNSNSYLSKPI